MLKTLTYAISWKIERARERRDREVVEEKSLSGTTLFSHSNIHIAPMSNEILTISMIHSFFNIFKKKKEYWKLVKLLKNYCMADLHRLFHLWFDTLLVRSIFSWRYRTRGTWREHDFEQKAGSLKLISLSSSFSIYGKPAGYFHTVVWEECTRRETVGRRAPFVQKAILLHLVRITRLLFSFFFAGCCVAIVVQRAAKRTVQRDAVFRSSRGSSAVFASPAATCAVSSAASKPSVLPTLWTAVSEKQPALRAPTCSPGRCTGRALAAGWLYCVAIERRFSGFQRDLN